MGQPACTLRAYVGCWVVQAPTARPRLPPQAPALDAVHRDWVRWARGRAASWIGGHTGNRGVSWGWYLVSVARIRHEHALTYHSKARLPATTPGSASTANTMPPAAPSCSFDRPRTTNAQARRAGVRVHRMPRPGALAPSTDDRSVGHRAHCVRWSARRQRGYGGGCHAPSCARRDRRRTRRSCGRCIPWCRPRYPDGRMRDWAMPLRWRVPPGTRSNTARAWMTAIRGAEKSHGRCPGRASFSSQLGSAARAE